MTAAELAVRVQEELAAASDPKFRDGVNAFFKEPVNAWGVRSPDVHRIAASAAREAKRWTDAEKKRFAADLWQDSRLEAGAAVICFYRCFSRGFGEPEFRLFERWIDRHVRNWAHCDGVSSWLIAASVGNCPALIPRLRAWTAARSRWKRRAAIVSLLQEAKQGRNLDAIFEIADALLEDADDMVQKGVGWVLKETYPKQPGALMAFLLPRAKRAPRLVLRIAAEKMTAADRARTLART